jgi:phage terminase small subunit
MARAPDLRKEEARKLFENGSILIEIANQLNVPDGTVRSWKNRGKWKCNATQKKKCNVVKKKKKEKSITKEVKQVMENEELNDKQRLFCLYYIKYFNATKAYKKAYECSSKTASVNGSRLLANAKVRNQIQSLKQGKLNRELLSTDDIVQRYIDVAFADITDYADFGTREVTFSDSEGREATTEMSYVDAKPAWMVDGSLLSEVSMSKGSIKIKLLDQMKAMQWLTDHMDLLTTEQKARVEHMKEKDELVRQRFNHQKDMDERSNF